MGLKCDGPVIGTEKDFIQNIKTVVDDATDKSLDASLDKDVRDKFRLVAWQGMQFLRSIANLEK